MHQSTHDNDFFTPRGLMPLISPAIYKIRKWYAHRLLHDKRQRTGVHDVQGICVVHTCIRSVLPCSWQCILNIEDERKKDRTRVNKEITLDKRQLYSTQNFLTYIYMYHHCTGTMSADFCERLDCKKPKFGELG